MIKNKLILAILLFTVFSSHAFAAEYTWATKSNMNTARYDLNAASIDDLLYVVGGHDGSSGSVHEVEVYNPATDKWVTAAPIPSPTYEGVIGVIDGKLYVAGGWDWPVSNIPTRTLQIYDPASNTWSTGADMQILSGCSTAGVINRKLYVLTACDGYSGFRKYLHVYDPDSNSWIEKTSSPNIHAYAAGGVIDGKFYVIGGTDGSNAIATLDVYDPATDTWVTKASMPTARRSLASGVVDGKLYAIGGNDGTKAVATVEVYDPTTNSWTDVVSIQTARSALEAAVISGKIYAVGGIDGTKVLATLEVFSSVVTPAPTPTATATDTPEPIASPTTTSKTQTTITTTPDKFRVGPEVRLRPVNDVIEAQQDGIIELFMRNPSLNDVTLHVDASVSVPSGIHVYGEGFAQAVGAGTAAGTFDVPPGTARTITVVIKADKSARLGSHTIQFSGLYYAGDNKDSYQPMSLTYPIVVKEASDELESSEPAPEATPGMGLISVLSIFSIFAIARFLSRKI